MNTPTSRITLSLLALFFGTASSFAQEAYQPRYSDPLLETWRWQRLNELGSNNRRIEVNDSGNALIQKITSNNRLWFYDGSELRYLKNLTSEGPTQWLLTFGFNNEILLFSNEGVYRYEEDTWNRLLTHSFRINYNNELVRAGDNRFWIAGNDGILEFDGQHISEHPLDQISATGVHNLVLGNDEELWMVVKPTGDVYRCPLVDGRLSPQSDWKRVYESGRELVGLSSLVLSMENQLWIVNSHEGDGALVYDIASDTWQNYNLRTLGGENFSTSMMLSHDGRVWILSRASLQIYDGNSWSIFKGPEYPIPDGRAYLTQDSEGYVYLLERGARITRIDYRQNQYRSLTGLHFQSEGLDGNFWYLDVNGNVVTEDRNSGEWFYFSTIETGVDAPVALVTLNNGHILCAGSASEVASFSIYNGREWTLYSFPKFALGFSHQGIIKLQNGDVLFGCGQPENEYVGVVEGGILRLTYRQSKYVVEHHDTLEAPFRPWTMVEDPLTGSVWSGANDLMQFDPGVPGRIVAHPGDAWIDKLAVTNSGDLWIVSWGHGIFRQRSGEWENMSEDSIFSDHHFSHIIIPDGENPVVSTDTGLFRFDGHDWASIASNGLSLYRGGGSLKQSSDGSLWVNTTRSDWYYRGLQDEVYPEVKKSHFRTVQCLPDTLPPDTIIRDSGSSVFSSSTATVEWFGSDYWFKTPRGLLTYSYSLDGNPWSSYSSERQLTKTNWSHGNHTLRVRARDADFNFDPVPAFHSFQIILPIWRQTWAQVTIAVIVILIFSLITFIVRQRLKHLLELERIKLHFFTNISHELRTPLTLVLGPVEKLLMEKTDTRHSSYLRTIQTNTSRLLYLIDQLLDFRRVERGRLLSEPRSVDLVALIKNLMETFDFAFKEKKQSLVFKTPFESCRILFDEDSFYKIADNLLHNANKYTPPGGSIEISLSPVENQMDRDQIGRLELSVQDNGMGISDEIKKNIFEPFYQGSGKAGKVKEGVGIGLALVKELVDLVGGTIGVESPVPGQGNGSRFTFKFRVRDPEIMYKAEMDPVVVVQNQPTIEETVEEEGKTIRRAHIHLVEDNPDVLKFLETELSEDFEVSVSEDGLEAEEFVLEHVPDLVITDVMMPKQDGFGLCKHLKSNPITSHVPIIMLTAFKTPHHEEEGLSLGADDYIAKPVSLRLLKLKVSNLLEQRERLREKIRRDYGLLPSSVSKVRAVDKEFLDKAEEIAIRFLDDEFFGVEQFAQEMGMSRSNFYKKFRDLTGLSPASYVKVKRLIESARRIEAGDGNITEIAFDVGFSYVSYFSRCFKEHFGCPPSKYIVQQAENLGMEN